MKTQKKTEKTADDEALRTQLQIEWQDHFQTRAQSWRTIQISGALVLGLVGADIKFNEIWVTTTIGILLILTSLSSVAVTLRHWRIQIGIFRRIYRIEELLGLLNSLGEGHTPGTYSKFDVINPKRPYVPVFIIRIHIIITVFTVFYILARWIKPEWFSNL